MNDQLLKILLGALAGLLAIITGFLSWKFKRHKQKEKEKDDRIKQERERSKDINESYNRCMGKIKSQYNTLSAKDKNGNYVVKLDPDIRQALLKDDEEELRYYHKFDRIKLENNI